MKTTSIHVSAAVMVAISAASAMGQIAQSPVQTASLNRSEPGDAQQAVRFGRRPARSGDEVEQAISMEVRLNTSIRQGNELTERKQTTIRSQQRRVVATTGIEAGRTTAVRARYLAATKQLTITDAAAAGVAANAGQSAPPPTDQPVAGKTYFCRREPGDGGKLVITDERGGIPPMDEYEIVAPHMEMVGRANPLAQLLAGRTIAVGETVELPRELANQIFNLGERFGEVIRFDLTLERAQPHDGVACAVFLARVEAASSDASQMRLQVEGPLVVELDTCRAVQINLSGPIGISETRGSFSTAYQLLGTGQLKMSIASAYRDANR